MKRRKHNENEQVAIPFFLINEKKEAKEKESWASPLSTRKNKRKEEKLTIRLKKKTRTPIPLSTAAKRREQSGLKPNVTTSFVLREKKIKDLFGTVQEFNDLQEKNELNQSNVRFKNENKENITLTVLPQ